MLKAHIEAVQQNIALKVAVVVLLAGCVASLAQLSAQTCFELHVSCIMQGGVCKPVACSNWLSGYWDLKIRNMLMIKVPYLPECYTRIFS